MAEMRQHVAISREHPAFAGHFPGQPLLPGVVLLGEVLELLLREAPETLAGQPRISNVKFLAPVRPGASLEIRWTASAAQRPSFEVWCHAEGDATEAVLAASGQLERSGGPA